MEKMLADTKSYPLMYALAGLYTGKDLAEANDMVSGLGKGPGAR